jgi:hypothetical protein
MDAETRVALEASIKHWENNVAAETCDQASTSGEDCALCLKFNWRCNPEIDRSDNTDENACLNCPVRQPTGEPLCYNTPYYTADEAIYFWSIHIGFDDSADNEFRAAFRIAAQAELDFLRSLLPKDELA